MKRIILYTLFALVASTGSFAQNNFSIGGGYFGHVITHPGLVLEAEYEYAFSEKASFPIRLDLGCYNQLRNHTGVFLDLNFGFRRYFKSGFFIEESIGFGGIETIINDDIYKFDSDGTVQKGSKFNKPDFMPSLTLGLGYNLSKKNPDTQNLIWIRPKIMWQYPHKNTSVFSPCLQIGFTHKLSKK